MAILQPVIERKLSSLLGAPVSFEQLNISLLGGSIETIGVKAGDFLTVARVAAKAAVARALKGEIVVSSVTIEKPGGSVVSSRDRIVVLAPVAAG